MEYFHLDQLTIIIAALGIPRILKKYTAGYSRSVNAAIDGMPCYKGPDSWGCKG